MISQILETTTDEEGNTIYLVADTGLLVVNEDGETVNRHYLRTTETLEDLDIVARHTAYYYLKLDNITSYPMLKLYQMATMITYKGTQRATKLEHYYHVNKAPYFVDDHTNISPSQVYINTYSSAGWVSGDYYSIYSGFSTSVKIYVGDQCEEIVVDVTGENAISPDGNW